MSDSPIVVRKLTGKCQCGAVVYEVLDEFSYALNCHCSNCRRATGAAFKSLAGIASDKLKIVQGGQMLTIYGSEGWHDERCRICGSTLFSIVQEGRMAHVLMGTLVDAPTIRPRAHIFVGSKAPWFEITDDLPQYDEHAR